jgi:2-keto-4-pentenoate hydratase/2-oxohepta-3-ene-1,7-dioic acid hydratase in catechol pathway
MKLLTFDYQNQQKIGVLLGQTRVLDLAAADQLINKQVTPCLVSMQALIDAGDEGMEHVKELVANPLDECIHVISELQLHAPLPIPMQIRDFANYELHCQQALQASMKLRASKEDDPEAALEKLQNSGAYVIPKVWYEIPLYYKCNRFAIGAPGQDIHWPEFSDTIDYELEMACVIGKKGKDIPYEEAREHIFGYTIFNDLSARDVQARWEGQFRMGPAKGKDFDNSNVFGPVIVTKDELTDPYNLTMIVRVNGEERGRGNSGENQHNFERCIAQVSRSETLYPGEILGLGTVGNGSGFESLTWLESGDVVELEIEGIGIIKNRILKD